MKLYSTNNKSRLVSLKEAVLKGLPEDNGLYMPLEIPVFSDVFFDQIDQLSFQELAFQVAKNLISRDEIPEAILQELVFDAISFPAPLVHLHENVSVLELFHGPSLAFKDFGARFMARVMGYFNEQEEKELVILVATSGDTGGAVAAGFYKTPGIKVVILYPKGKVSKLQELQLTTFGENIAAIEVNGSFDDCQNLVKAAFLDADLRENIRLTSANSINIARLIPQTFYYFEAYRQLRKSAFIGRGEEVNFVVPSGNFGNLAAGYMAKAMGLPVRHFVAATNINDIVPDYIRTGIYSPRASVRTLSNAMDVGKPSNFVRILDLVERDLEITSNDLTLWHKFRDEIKGYAFDDLSTKDTVKKYAKDNNYALDPHTAVGLLACQAYLRDYPSAKELNNVVLATAHPIKFVQEVGDCYPTKDFVSVPKAAEEIETKQSNKDFLDAAFFDFKKYIEDNY